MFNTHALTDKTIIFFSCFFIYLFQPKLEVTILPVVTIIIISCMISYFEDEKMKVFLWMTFFICSYFLPPLILFAPLIFYDMFLSRFQWLMFILIPELALLDIQEPTFLLSISAVMLVSLWLKYRTNALCTLKDRFHKLSDDAREMSEKMQLQNHELSEKMYTDVNLATLTERNRIAREIHDNVGHQLSRAILQVGALLAINKEERLKEPLTIVSNTLSEAMTSIRESVHGLHDQSLDLHMQVETLIKNFTFCEIQLDDQLLTQPNKNQKIAFVSIAKEALNNVMKHSNATLVRILFREHPAFYQMIIQDNGTNLGNISSGGIGLLNMTERVQSLNGFINIKQDKGFEIFISVPKGENQ